MAITIFGLSTSVVPIFAQTWTRTSASFTNMQGVAHSRDATKLMATTGGAYNSGSIYVSSDSGKTWVLTSAPEENWTGLAVSMDGTRMTASVYNGSIYTSTNTGATWIKTSAPDGKWNALASSSDGTKLVAMAGNVLGGEVFISTNSGEAWTQATAPSGYWRDVASSASGDILVASIDPGLIYVSTNSGVTWTLTSAPTYNGIDTYIWTLMISADGSKMFVAGGFNGTGFGSIYASTNYGATWAKLGAPSRSWFSISGSSDGSRVVAAGDSQIYYSTNFGTTWTVTTLPSSGSVISSADGRKFVAIIGGATYTWSDSGVSWTKAALTTTSPSAVSSSADGTKLVAVSYFGSILVSANAGATWISALVDTNQMWVSAAISASGTNLVAVSGGWFGAGSIFYSGDAGMTWQIANAPETNWVSVSMSADGTRMIALNWGGSIYFSTNSGVTWKMADAPILNWWSVTSSADGKHAAAAAYGDVIYTSSNSGATWLRTGSPSGFWGELASSVVGDKLVAISSGAIYRSTNFGLNWDTAPTYFYFNDTVSIASSADGTKLAVAIYNGLIYISSDSGDSWYATSAPSGHWLSIASSADGKALMAISNFDGLYTSYSAPVPNLCVTPLSNCLALAWIVPSTNFVLQQNSDLTLANWVTLTNTPVLNLANLQEEVVLSPTNSSGFFRLITQ